MLIHELLAESGVKTADVDRAARAAIKAHMPEIARAIETSAEPFIGAYVPSEDGEEAHRYYDRLHQWFSNDRVTVINSICTELNNILTTVIRDVAEKRGIGKHRRNDYRVIIDPTETSDDTLKTTAKGYFDERNGVLKVFLAGDTIAYAAMGITQEKLFGEESDDYSNQFLGLIVPVFCHEYAHFEQSLRGKSFGQSDLGHITIGSHRFKDFKGKRFGRRGGYHRGGESPESYLRYLGTTHEIDSFASGAAAEFIHEIRQHLRWNHSPSYFNEQLRSLLQSLSLGWADSSSYRRYQEKYYASLEQRIPGLDHAQMTKVWKRFLRSLYAKLRDYLLPEHQGENFSNLDPEWVATAKTMPISKMIAYLVYVTAGRIGWKNRDADPAWIAKEIDHGLGGGYEGEQHKAERFIQNYYFRDNWFESKFDNYIKIFRRMLRTETTGFMERHRSKELT